ncbi:MAG TPA: dUTPase [Fibrobacteraceae bacterium]|nr:dUTPase [Fibrobacteraceae bacterium]
MAQPDMLQEVFRMQTLLNDYVFQKKDIRDRDGKVLTMAKLMEQGDGGEALGPNTEVNEWLSKYLTALDDESRELRAELLWKWWSKDNLNMQNVRVEIVDQLHFWISLAMTAGMDAAKVYDIYLQKNKVNIDRQNSGYSKATKNEDDNKAIG